MTMHISHNEMKHRLHELHDICHEVCEDAIEEIKETLKREPSLVELVEISKILKNLTAAKMNIMHKHKLMKEIFI